MTSSYFHRDFSHISLPNDFKFGESFDEDEGVRSGESDDELFFLNCEEHVPAGRPPGQDKGERVNQENLDCAEQSKGAAPPSHSTATPHGKTYHRAHSDGDRGKMKENKNSEDTDSESNSQSDSKLSGFCIGNMKLKLSPHPETRAKRLKVHPITDTQTGEKESGCQRDSPSCKDNMAVFLIASESSESGARSSGVEPKYIEKCNNNSADVKLETIEEHELVKSYEESATETPPEGVIQQSGDGGEAISGDISGSPSVSHAEFRNHADQLVMARLDRMLERQEATRCHMEWEVQNEALDLETTGCMSKPRKLSLQRPKIRRLNTISGCNPISRNVKTAPSTPEAENRRPPRHAESTSQLEMSSGYGKRTTNDAVKGVDVVPDLKLHDKKGPASMSKSRNEKFHKLFKNIPKKKKVPTATLR